MNIKQTIFRTLLSDVEMNLARFDEETGRFLTDGGWAVTNQDIIYPLALLYYTEAADNPYYGDARVLNCALRGGDALREFQYPNGQVEFIKVDDSTWGPIYMPWSMYHWVEAYGLLRADLGAARRARWEEGLTLAFDGIAGEISGGRVHNIPVWHAMALYRAGQLLARADWQERGRWLIAKAVDEQAPGGYWYEHGGPTPVYNYVYVHAIGLYYFFSGDESVLPCLERATDFHIRYTYPDGRTVETIDGRVKYRNMINPMGLASFSLFPQGRRLARLMMENWLQQRAAEERPSITYIVTGGERKPSGGEFGLNPRLTSVHVHYQDGPEAPIPQDEASYQIHDPGHAIVRREAGWVACLSGYVTPPVETRWGSDRQNFLSVWHEGSGLITGGGNAKSQPVFSSFILGEDILGDDVAAYFEEGAEPPDVSRYVPVSAQLEPGENEDALTLTLDGCACTASVRVVNEGRLEVTFSTAGNDSSHQPFAQLPLKLAEHEPITTGGGESHPLTNQRVKLTAADAGGWIGHHGWRILMPADSTVEWPVLPFNPYAADGAAPLTDAKAILRVPVTGDPVTVTLIVDKPVGV